MSSEGTYAAVIGAAAELERKAENERFRIWEAGFQAGLRMSTQRTDEPGPFGYYRPKNPYQWHGA